MSSRTYADRRPPPLPPAQHLGAFGITGLTGLQKIGTLSGGQKSRVAFSVLSMQRPHIILLDEPSNHLDIEGIDALMAAIKKWNGGVILISHDTRFITNGARLFSLVLLAVVFGLTVRLVSRERALGLRGRHGQQVLRRRLGKSFPR